MNIPAGRGREIFDEISNFKGREREKELTRTYPLFRSSLGNNDNNEGEGLTSPPAEKDFSEKELFIHARPSSTWKNGREFRGISWLRVGGWGGGGGGKAASRQTTRTRGRGGRGRGREKGWSLFRRLGCEEVGVGEVKRQYRRKLIIGVRCTPRREQNTGEQ